MDALLDVAASMSTGCETPNGRQEVSGNSEHGPVASGKGWQAQAPILSLIQALHSCIVTPAGSTNGTHEAAEVQQAAGSPRNSPFPQDAAGGNRSVAASVSSSPTNRLALLPSLHPAMQKGICYDNEVFIPPDKQPAEKASSAANATRRISQQAAPLDEELLADMHCLDNGGEHVDSLLQERMCLPRLATLNPLKRPHPSSQQIRRVEQQETRRNLTSSSRTASATLSEGDVAGKLLCLHGKSATASEPSLTALKIVMLPIWADHHCNMSACSPAGGSTFEATALL